MARNGTWIALALALAGQAAADDALVERWDKPRRESFGLKHALPEEVAREIRSRYGVAFDADVLEIPRMDFEAENVTFLEALDRLAAGRGLLLTGWTAREGPLRLVRARGPLPPTPVAHVGASRLSVQRLTVLTSTDWTPPHQGLSEDLLRTLSPRLRVYFADWEKEPRLRVGFAWVVEPGLEQAKLVGWDVLRAEDNSGKPVAVKVPPDLPVAANGGFTVDFVAPPRNSRSIARIEGRLRVALPAREQEVELRAGERGRPKEFGSARAWLGDVDTLQAIVRFTIDGSPCEALEGGDSEPDVLVGNAAAQRAPFLTVLAYRADGTAIAGSLQRTWSDINSTSRTYWIDLDDVPDRIVLRATTAALVREAPFAFNDIPLPE